MKTKSILLILLLCLFMGLSIFPAFAEDSATVNDTVYGINKQQTTQSATVSPTQKKYTITPNTSPCSKKIRKYSTYNKYTKNYYTLISYMMFFEKNRGGTLVLKKGTYTISNTVPIPSNVNLILEDGVVINKGTKTGTRKFKASSTIFQLVHPSKLKKSRAYSKYNGVRNVKIIGKGTSTINLRYLKNNIAIVCGHNQNILLQGITFKNLNSGHFIELDATNGMKISNCKFISSKPSSMLTAEAINLDTPDKNTKGFNNVWSSYDKTPNNAITIENNVFNGLDRAIGTHKYSQRTTNGRYVTNKGQVYHMRIIIRNNIITNTRSDSIRVMNWKNSEITNNYISYVTRNSKQYRAILASGAINLKIKFNYFKNMNRPIQILSSKNSGYGSIYSVTYNSLTSYNYQDMKYNLCFNVGENFARISNKYQDYSNQIWLNLLT